MTPLRQRMIEDMQVRNLADKTQKCYVGHVAQFAQHFNRSPKLLGPEEIRDYQVYLVQEREVSTSVMGQVVAALRFLYGNTLQQPWSVERIPYPKQGRKLPVIPSRQEVVRFLSAIKNLKHRALLTTVYACGLRCAEATHLRVGDIDSQRMLIHVQQGKGRKDRFVMLSVKLLSLLREYWKAHRPQDWLFPGRYEDRPILPNSVRHVCRRVRKDAGLSKPITPHGLRNASA